MEQPKPNIANYSKTHPLIASLPKALKDPANYEKIKKAISDTMIVKDTKLEKACVHEDIASMSTCPRCTKNMLARRMLLKKLGFKNPAQYWAWQKVHEEIKQMFPLVDWKQLNRERIIEDLK